MSWPCLMQVEQYSFIAVVGDAEMQTGAVAVRTRDGDQRPPIALDAWIKELRQLQTERSSTNTPTSVAL